MDKYDLRARGVTNKSRQLRSLGEKHTIGKVKNLSDCCGSEKQEHESDNEISNCECAKSVAMGSKCLNCEHLSSSECIKENACDCGSLSSVISTSTSLTQNKEISGGGSCMVISCCSGVGGNENIKDGELPKQSSNVSDAKQDISMSSDDCSETRQLPKENNELLIRTDMHYRSVDEDGKQLITESSSSNSSRIVLPASSNDSYQEALACKFSKASDMVTLTSADKKCSPKQCLVKSSVLGGASETVRNSGAVGCDKERGIIADGNTMIVEKNDLLTSNLCKMKITELPNQSNANTCYEVDDALEVAFRVAKEVEQDVRSCKEASGSSSTVEEKNSETVKQGSVDSVNPTRKDLLTESAGRVKSCDEPVKGGAYGSAKDVEDRKMSMKGKQFCVEVDESSENMGPKLTIESSCLTTKPEDISCNGQTTDVSGIDLNEDFLENETDYPMQSVEGMESHNSEHVSKPIPVVATSGISVCFPISQKEGKPGGWRGSSVTSAFRRTPFFQKSSGNKTFFPNNDTDGSKPSNVKGIDLNIAASGVDFDSDFLPDKCVAAPPSSLHFEKSSADVCSTRIGRLDFDLNCASESNDNGHLSSPPASPSKPYARDFDLNDNPISRGPCSDAHWSGQGTQPLRMKASEDPALHFLANSRQLEPNRVCHVYMPDMSSAQGFSHGNAKHYPMAAPSMLPPAEQMQRVASLHHNMTYTPPPLPSHAFHYNQGLFFRPNNHLSSPLYPSAALPYMTDPRGANLMPQMVGSPAFPGISHSMELAGGQGPIDMATVRPNFDPNNALEKGSRGAIPRYHQYIPPLSSNSVMEDQLRSFQQSALSFKRREPEGGWESHQLIHRQVNPWR